jgi:hypothetical protein
MMELAAERSFAGHRRPLRDVLLAPVGGLAEPLPGKLELGEVCVGRVASAQALEVV